MISNIQSDRKTKMIFRLENVNIYYGSFLAVKNVSLEIPQNRITAFVGPSGCGKSTVLRSFNRLNELLKSFHLDGKIYYHDRDLYAPDINPEDARRRIGIVFQQPNPFPRSIYENIAFWARINGCQGDMDELVDSASN
ncbi:ATP-binding cassette domain-containing protein [Phormidium tenue FACHB-886]|nr:ATP-binding cassette domain-containing protein [Phormidium tenue FACHB-886]